MKTLFKVALVLVIGVLLFGCTAKSTIGLRVSISSVNAEAWLPMNAEVITEHGNGWIEFELEGNRFLYRHVKSGYAGYEALTQIK